MRSVRRAAAAAALAASVPAQAAFAPASEPLARPRPLGLPALRAAGAGEGGDERAGKGGYSVLRRPVTWDKEDLEDPKFSPPTDLDAAGDGRAGVDAAWFEGRGRGRDAAVGDSGSGSGSGPAVDALAAPTRSASHHRLEEADQQIDLLRRTVDTLDYPLVLGALSEECGTVPARSIIAREIGGGGYGASNRARRGAGEKKVDADADADADVLTMPLTAADVGGIHRRYAAVREMRRLLQAVVPLRAYNPVRDRKVDLFSPPMGGMALDIEPVFSMVDAGQVLEGPEILEVATTLEVLQDVNGWAQALSNVDGSASDDGLGMEYDEDEEEAITEFVELPRLGAFIEVDDDLLDLLTNAFDDDGRISGVTFPEVGMLRAKVRTLKRGIISTLDSLLTTPSISSKLSLESGGPTYSEVNGRIVIPVADKFKNSVGIMHDVSRSGKTVYCEPNEIVGATNEMRQAEVELRSEEARVWRSLTESIVERREEIERGVAAAAQIDLVLARYRLGEKVRGTIPSVGDEGVMSLKDARHPVLLLRDLDDVVPNDIDIGADGNQGIVLTGPNSGGKTIILKLMGLCALMAKDGVPIPASKEGARVDFFGPVIADIGDIQSVDGDLSTFSGHMLVCREVLANSGKNALVLMDEPGSGTDPSQGVAIAQALLEALLKTGSRVAITTHFVELKQLASSDDRFSVAGMQFVGGRPTYRLQAGVVGESFALAVAERLNLPHDVLARANELLDSETRQMGELIRDMEDQKMVIDQQAAEIVETKRDLMKIESEMMESQRRLEAKQLSARRDEAKKFAKMLEEKEQILEDVLEKLKKDPSKKLIARSWDDLRFVKRDALNEAENIPSVLKKQLNAAAALDEAQAELVPLSEMREKPNLKIGDALVICKKGSSLVGKEGTISKMGKKIELKIGNMPVILKMSELALPLSTTKVSASNPKSTKQVITGPNGETLSKTAQRALAGVELDRNTPVRDLHKNGSGKGNESGNTFRLDANTVDVRGCTFEEAKQKCQNKFGSVMTQKSAVVFILHGHGTGALKKKLRQWLQRDKQWVKSFKKAREEDGGDAFTQVQVKNLMY